jgi:hypothetical protein
MLIKDLALMTDAMRRFLDDAGLGNGPGRDDVQVQERNRQKTSEGC